VDIVRLVIRFQIRTDAPHSTTTELKSLTEFNTTLIAIKSRKTHEPPPNKPMQLTPLRVREILAFLKAGFGSNVVPIYRWRRN
jgi:hypothetical protein